MVRHREASVVPSIFGIGLRDGRKQARTLFTFPPRQPELHLRANPCVTRQLSSTISSDRRLSLPSSARLQVSFLSFSFPFHLGVSRVHC